MDEDFAVEWGVGCTLNHAKHVNSLPVIRLIGFSVTLTLLGIPSIQYVNRSHRRA
jgi:hypothetical protein